ncbi:hypothetical protein J6G99_07120 [bacterium]|nr:hypothetical protein [bacterium]
MGNLLSKVIKYITNADGHIMAPKLCWRTSLIGSKCNYLLNSVKDCLRPNKTGNEFLNIMASSPSAQDIKRACDLFEKETGIKMLMTNPKGAMSFSTNANILIRDIKKERFPKNIKYIVIGHGEGTILNDTWHVAYAPQVKIFDFIEQNIPKGEMVLVNCCETTPKELKHLIPKNKPAIGRIVTEFDSSYKTPAKIVISGTREIVGGYANGFLTLYK